MCYYHRCFGRLEFQVQSRNSTLNSTSSKTNKHCFNLLLHFHSHTDKRYKDSLLKTMIHRACALSSATEAFNAECVKLRSIFSQIALYFQSSSVINHFLYRNASAGTVKRNTDDSSTVRISLPFKDQVAANANLLKENQFRVLRKCRGKFDCLVFEMLFIKNLKPNFNIQTYSIRASLFFKLLLFFSYGIAFYHPLLFW